MRELRRNPRIPAQWEVTVTDGAGQAWRGTAIDVSPLGMQVKLTKPLRPHRFLLLSLTPPDGKGPLWADVRIVRQHSPLVYALHFLNLSSVAAQRLAPLIESWKAAGPSDRPQRAPARRWFPRRTRGA